MSEFSGSMYNVYSGNIKQAGWEFDEENKRGTLRVVFKNERTYDYWPVPKQLFNKMWKAESKGKWFNENIKNNLSISYEEVD